MLDGDVCISYSGWVHLLCKSPHDGNGNGNGKGWRLSVHHLADPVFHHDGLVAADVEAALAGEHAVLEVFVALIARLCCVVNVYSWGIELMWHVSYLESEVGDCFQLV